MVNGTFSYNDPGHNMSAELARPAVFLQPCDSKSTWKLTEHRDSCEALCYVVNACWNSQINGRGSRPNQGSIPGYILVLWAVVHPGRRQYLLLPWHSDRQDGGSGNHFSTSHFRGDFIPDWGNPPFFQSVHHFGIVVSQREAWKWPGWMFTTETVCWRVWYNSQ